MVNSIITKELLASHACQVQTCHSKIAQLEQELLRTLSQSQNLLDDGDLLGILAKTKQMSQARFF